MSIKENIYQFIDLPRIDPNKKPISERKEKFVEIYKNFNLQQSQVQADRCLSCGNPYCQFECPLHNNIPDWLRLVYENRIIEAADLAFSTNTLPEVCGRVCPQDRLCEGACTLNEDYGAVTIGAIEKFIFEEAISQGWKPIHNQIFINNLSKKVAVIGSGPAGLGCIDILVQNSVNVTVYEKQQEIGGLLTFGIPTFKLEKDVIVKRRKLFEEMGIDFKLGVEIGKDIDLLEIIPQYDAVFLGVGAYKSIKANVDNEDAIGVYSALPFLIDNTKLLMGIETDDYINVKDKTVVVLGGGDTAMDCIRTAIRQGATEVTCIYRRDENNMPGSKREVLNAKEEGAKFVFNAQPISIEVKDKLNEQAFVTGVKIIKTTLDEKDANGRNKVKHIPNSEQIIQCDIVIVAFGFSVHEMPWIKPLGVDTDDKGRIEVKEGEYPQQTSNEKIFAAGDVTRGSDLVVTAIAEGRKAGQSILEYLGL